MVKQTYTLGNISVLYKVQKVFYLARKWPFLLFFYNIKEKKANINVINEFKYMGININEFFLVAII